MASRNNNQTGHIKMPAEELLFSIGEGAVMVDMERTVLQLNRGAEELTGCTDREAFGRPLSEVLGNPVSADPVEMGSAKARRFEEPAVLRSAGGKLFFVRSAVPVFDKDGKTFRVILVFSGEKTAETSAPETAPAEDKYRAVFCSMLNGCALVEMAFQDGKPFDYRFIDMNPAYEEMTGCKKAECLGKTFREVTPYAEDYWIDIYGKVALTGTPARFRQYSVFLGKYFEVNASHMGENQVAICLLDNTEQKKTEDSLLVSEKKARAKLNSIVSPKGNIDDVAFSEILDIREIGPLMSDFYRITHVPAAITDNNGRILLSNGMQEICTRFHWNNKESGLRCPLSAGQPVVPGSRGKFEVRRCQNGLWSLSVPVRVDGRQLGFLFICQFMMQEESRPEERFIRQAQEFGYNHSQYLSALEQVPRIRRDTLQSAVSFYIRFAEILSVMSMRNLQLARSYMQAENTRVLLKAGIEGFKEINIVMVDAHYRSLFFNQAYKETVRALYGREPKTEENMLESIAAEADRESIREGLNRAITGESQYTMQEYGTAQKRYFESFFSPICSKGQEVIGVTVFSRDVSQRRRTEMAIETSEARHKAMLANIADAIMILDENGCCRYVSPNAKDKFGRAFEMGEKVIDLRYIHSADRRLAKLEFTRLLQAPEGKISMEMRFVGADGKFHSIDLTAANLMEDPNIRGILINFHDITDRKKKEREIVYLTEHNSMTGLYNRWYFDKQLKKLDIKENLPLSVIIGDINGLKMINDALGHFAGDKMIVEISRILKGCIRKGDVLARTGGDEFSILLPRATGEQAYGLIKRIHAKCREHESSSNVYYLSISMGYATKTAESELIGVKIKEAEDNMYKHKLLEHKSLHNALISSIKTTMMEKDFRTEEHAERLALLSGALGKALRLNPEQMDELQLLSTLHDIGKIVVEDRILKKRTPLTGMEWEELKKHPEVGYRIAMASPDLISIADFILCHHERWDGTGYPQGIAGEDIPLLARILAVTDSYDAMTQDRPYRKALSKQQAIAEIRENAGSQFDPEIARIFVDDILMNEEY